MCLRQEAAVGLAVFNIYIWGNIFLKHILNKIIFQGPQASLLWKANVTLKNIPRVVKQINEWILFCVALNTVECAEWIGEIRLPHYDDMPMLSMN